MCETVITAHSLNPTRVEEQTLQADVALLRETATMQRMSSSPQARAAAKVQLHQAEQHPPNWIQEGTPHPIPPQRFHVTLGRSPQLYG